MKVGVSFWERNIGSVEMGLEGVGDLSLHIVLSKLGAEDAARVACVSRRLRVSSSEDSLWSEFCSRDLCLSAPLDPHGNPAHSFKVIVPGFRFWFLILLVFVALTFTCWHLDSWFYISSFECLYGRPDLVKSF